MDELQGMDGEGRVFGGYRILSTLGSGGMGVVYAAWDTRLQRQVALKMIHPHLLSNPASIRRFRREAMAAARVEHPNVVRTYQMIELEGELAIEMQYIEGRPLSQMSRPMAMPAGQAASLMDQVLDALSACHGKGIIHCDIKPANLLIDGEGRVYISDFGIARALQNTSDDPAGMTITGPAWGTPRYTPPEAWEGENPAPSWDLYALGLLVYEALAARPAFQANTPAGLMAQILTETPESLERVRPDLSREFAELIHELIARAPGMRPASAVVARERLHQTQEFELLSATTLPRAPAGVVTKRVGTSVAHAPESRNGRVRALAWAVALLLVLGVGLTLWNRPPVPETAPVQSPPESAATPEQEDGPPVAGDGSEGETRTPEETGAAASSAPVLSEPMEMVGVGNGAYFSYDDGIHGRELWFVGDDGMLVMVADLLPGPESGNPRHMYSVRDNSLLFGAVTPNIGEELWRAQRYHSWEHSLRLIQDIMPGPMSSEPHVYANCDRTFLFDATTLHHGRELWITNSRSPQTMMVKDVFPRDDSSVLSPPNVQSVPHGLYYVAYTDFVQGPQVFYYNHARIDVEHVGPLDHDPGPIAALASGLLAGIHTPEDGRELTVYHHAGPERKTVRLDLVPGPGSSDPKQLWTFKNRVYFSARTEATGHELWVTDGTLEGTRLLKDIEPGPEGSDVHHFVACGDYLIFRATTSAHGRELWMTDGTPEGTRMLHDAAPGPESGTPYNTVTEGSVLFFAAHNPGTGHELYMVDFEKDGVPRLVADLAAGPAGAEPYLLCFLVQSKAVFKFKSPETGPMIGLVDWSGEAPAVTAIPLPHARKGDAPEPVGNIER